MIAAPTYGNTNGDTLTLTSPAVGTDFTAIVNSQDTANALNISASGQLKLKDALDVTTKMNVTGGNSAIETLASSSVTLSANQVVIGASSGASTAQILLGLTPNPDATNSQVVLASNSNNATAPFIVGDGSAGLARMDIDTAGSAAFVNMTIGNSAGSRGEVDVMPIAPGSGGPNTAPFQPISASSSPGNMIVGNGGAGLLYIKSGTGAASVNRYPTVGDLMIGAAPGGQGTVDMTSNDKMTVKGDLTAGAADSSFAVLQTNGNLDVKGVTAIGTAANTKSTVTITSGGYFESEGAASIGSNPNAIASVRLKNAIWRIKTPGPTNSTGNPLTIGADPVPGPLGSGGKARLFLDSTSQVYAGPTTIASDGFLEGTGEISTITTVNNGTGTTSSLATLTDNGTILPGNTAPPNGVPTSFQPSGAVQPSNDVQGFGILRVTSNIDMGSTATLGIDISGTTVGTQYDQLNVQGNVTLGGTLKVNLVGNFTPSLDQSFKILDAYGLATQNNAIVHFSSLVLPDLHSGLAWAVDYVNNPVGGYVSLNVVKATGLFLFETTVGNPGPYKPAQLNGVTATEESRITATVNWGQGEPADATVYSLQNRNITFSADGHGFYNGVVSGSHVYSTEGQRYITTTFSLDGKVVGVWETEVSVSAPAVKPTSFYGNSTTNSLVFSYNVAPPGGSWPTDGSNVTIPSFTLKVYAVPTGSFDDTRINDPGTYSYNLIASYPITDSEYLTANASNNQFTLNLDPSQINYQVLESLGSRGQYLVAEIDFGDGVTPPVLARFQGGSFQTADGTVFAYGGASLEDDTPDSADYTNTYAIASAGNGVTVSGNVSGWDTPSALSAISESYTAAVATANVYAYVYNNDSAIDASGLNSSMSLIALAGDGTDSITGGEGNDMLTVGNGDDTLADGNGNDTLTAGDGNDSISVGDGSDTLTAGNGNNSVTLGNGNDYVVIGDGDNNIVGGNGQEDIGLGQGNNYVQVGNGPDILGAGGGNNLFQLGAGDDSVWLGNGNNIVSFASNADGLWDYVVAGDGNNTVEVASAAELRLGNGNNVVEQTGTAGSGQQAAFDVGTGNNTFYMDGQSAGSSFIDAAGSGSNEIYVANLVAGTSPTPDWYGDSEAAPYYGSVIGLPSGGSITYISPTSDLPALASLYDSGDNTLTLDNGGTTYGLPNVPSGANISIANGSTLNLADQSASLGTVTLADGTIGNGSISATSFDLQNGEIDANLSGGPLSVTGGGTVVLTGDNSSLGATSVSGGSILQISSASNLGAESSITLNGGTLQVNGNIDITVPIVLGAGGGTIDTNGYSVILSGGVSTATGVTTDGGLTVIDSSGGSGSLEISGSNNTYNGGTILAGGTVFFDSAASVPSSGLVDVQSGGTLQETSGLTAAAWLGNSHLSTSSSGTLALATAASNNTETLDMSSYPGLSLGAVPDVTYSGTLTPANSTFMLGGGLGTLTVATTLSGSNSDVINGNVVLASSGNSYSGGTTVNAGGILQIAGSLPGNVLDNGAVDFIIANDLIFGGNISGSGSVTQDGSGVVTLTGTDSATGGTTIENGTLEVTNDDTISGAVEVGAGTMLAVAVDSNGVVNGQVDAAGISSMMENVTFNPGSSFGINTTRGFAYDSTANNPLSGDFTLVNLGMGTLTLNGENDYEGTVLENGTLAVNFDASLGDPTQPITFTGPATLKALGNLALPSTQAIVTPVVSGEAATIDTNGYMVSLAGPVSGTGPLNVIDSTNSTGTLVLTGDISTTAATTVASGVFQIGDGTTNGTVGGNIVDNAGVVFDVAGNTSNSNVISGSGSVTKTGPGSLGLLGTNTYRGGTTIVLGLLSVNSNASLGDAASTLTFAGPATLQAAANVTLAGTAANGQSYNRPIVTEADVAFIFDTQTFNLTVPGNISGLGVLQLIGDGKLTISGINTFTGGFAVYSATLVIDGYQAVPGGFFNFTIGSITSPDVGQTFTAGEIIQFQVPFSSPAYVTGTPLLELSTGGYVSAAATYASGSGTDVLTFDYIVQSNDSTRALDYASANALILNGGTIDGYNASTHSYYPQSLSLPSPRTAGSLTPDAIAIVNPLLLNSIQRVGAELATGDTSLQFTVNFSMNVTGVSASDFALTGGNSSGTISSVTGSGSTYTVTVTNVSGNGDLSLVLANGSGIHGTATGTAYGGESPDFTAQDYVLSNTFYWDGEGTAGSGLGGSGAWNTGANWRVGSSTGPLHSWVDGVNAVLGGDAGTVTLPANAIVNSLQMSNAFLLDLAGQNLTVNSLNAAGEITNSGGQLSTLTVSDGGAASGIIENGNSPIALNLTGGTLQIDNDDTFTGGTTIAAGATADVGGGGTDGNILGSVVDNGALDFAPSATTVIACNISGSGSVAVSTQWMSSPITISGNNSGFAGSFETSGSEGIIVGSATAFGSAHYVSSNTPLDLSGYSETFACLDSSASITNNGSTAATITIGSGGGSEYAAISNGSGGIALDVVGGYVSLFNSDTYSGGTYVASGANLNVGSNGTGGGIIDNVTDDGTINFAPIGTTNITANISGWGLVYITTQWSSGPVTISGNNSGFTGQFHTAGSEGIVVGGANVFGAANYVSSNTPLDLNGYSETFACLDSSASITNNGSTAATITIGANGGSEIAAIANGSSSIALNVEGGYVSLFNADSFTGGTYIAPGAHLNVGWNGQYGSIAGNIVDDGTLNFAPNYAAYITANISGWGLVYVTTQWSSGPVTISGNDSSFTGQFETAGSEGIVVGSANVFGSASYVSSNTPLDLNGYSVTFACLDSSASITNNGSTAATITIGSGGGSEYAAISNGRSSVALNVEGGYVSIYNYDTYSGGTYVASGGHLIVGWNGSYGSIQGNIVDNGEVAFGSNSPGYFGGQISGYGWVWYNGQWNSGTFALGGSDSFAGGMLVTSGTLVIYNSTALGTSSETVQVNNATLDLEGQWITVGTIYTTTTMTIVNHGTNEAAITVSSTGVTTYYSPS